MPFSRCFQSGLRHRCTPQRNAPLMKEIQKQRRLLARHQTPTTFHMRMHSWNRFIKPCFIIVFSTPYLVVSIRSPTHLPYLHANWWAFVLQPCFLAISQLSLAMCYPLRWSTFPCPPLPQCLLHPQLHDRRMAQILGLVSYQPAQTPQVQLQIQSQNPNAYLLTP